ILDGTATKLRLTMDYNEIGRAAGLPPSMCLKIGLNPAHLKVSSAIYAAEGRFYNEFAPSIPALTLPRCYSATTDRETGQSTIFLEDLSLRGAAFGDIRNGPVCLEVIRKLVDWLALLHARYWEDPVLDSLTAWATDRLEAWMEWVMEPTWWNSYVTGPR